MTTFYEGDTGGMRELSGARYRPAVDAGGAWGVVDLKFRQQAFIPGVRYLDSDAAMAFADLLNAIDEGQPAKVLDDLRWDLAQVRNPMNLRRD